MFIFWLDNHFKQKLKQARTLKTLDILVKDTLAVTLAALIKNGSKTKSFGLTICGTLIEPGWHGKMKRSRQLILKKATRRYSFSVFRGIETENGTQNDLKPKEI